MSQVEPEIPEYYQPGATLSVKVESTNTLISLRVIRAFAPFTMAQAILVEHDPANSPPGLDLPATFLLKVYDPRFYSHRLPLGTRPARPWTFEAEKKATAEREEDENGGRDPDFEAWRQPDDDDAPGWEEWYFQNSEMQYHAEVTSYEFVKPLQGTTVVKCYGTGLLQLQERALAPHALLLEFLPEVKRLDQVDPKVVSTDLVLSLMETAKEFGKLGIVHTDLNPGNILFSPGDKPVRAVVIDFGESGYREEETDEEWQEILEQQNDIFWMRRRLEPYFSDVLPKQATS